MSSEYTDTNNSNERAVMDESDPYELSDFHKSIDSSNGHESSSFSAFNSSSLSGYSSLDKPPYVDSVHENMDRNAATALPHLFEVGGESNNFISFHEYSINKDVHDEPDSDSHSATESRPTLVHGFSFGNISIPFERKNNFNECDEEDDDEEDEGIGGVYGTDGLLELKAENRSIGKPSPVENRRHVISKQIGRVGNIGQNIGLGHQIGVLAEDSELRPKPVVLEKRTYILDEESPLQTNVCWSKPGNADNFKHLTYEIEMKSLLNSDQWIAVVSVKFPVFRVYHTEDKLFIGKMHFLRQSQDVSFTLRIRSHGEAMLPSSFIQDLKSDWSKEIIITFLGYETHNVVEQTSL